MTILSPVGRAMRTLRDTVAMMRRGGFKFLFEEYPAMSEADLNEWQDILREELPSEDYSIPAALRALYAECGGFKFQWQCERRPDLRGSSELATLLELYQTDEEHDQPMSAVFQKPRKFDVIGDREYVAVAFECVSDVPLKMIWIDDDGATRRELALDPIEYVNRLADYRAVYGWQRLFAAGAVPEDSTLLTDLERLFGAARNKD